MNKPTFFDYTPKQLQKVYPEILANSKAQYDAALSLASSGQYGIALPHVLVSGEESIKALIIALDAHGFKVRKIEGVDIFFRHHEIRFFVGFFMFGAAVMGRDLVKWLKHGRDNPTNFMEVFGNRERRDRLLRVWLVRKMTLLQREVIWFSQAEYFRQQGMYVDMKENLASPLKITPKEFEEARQRVEMVNKVIKNVIETLSDPAYKKQLANMKRMVTRKKFHEAASAALLKVKKNREPFFSLLLNFMTDIDGMKTEILNEKII